MEFREPSLFVALACNGIVCEQGGACMIASYSTTGYVCICKNQYSGTHCGIYVPGRVSQGRWQNYQISSGGPGPVTNADQSDEICIIDPNVNQLD